MWMDDRFVAMARDRLGSREANFILRRAEGRAMTITLPISLLGAYLYAELTTYSRAGWAAFYVSVLATSIAIIEIVHRRLLRKEMVRRGWNRAGGSS
jgi:hypothetical protein